MQQRVVRTSELIAVPPYTATTLASSSAVARGDNARRGCGLEGGCRSLPPVQLSSSADRQSSGGDDDVAVHRCGGDSSVTHARPARAARGCSLRARIGQRWPRGRPMTRRPRCVATRKRRGARDSRVRGSPPPFRTCGCTPRSDGNRV